MCDFKTRLTYTDVKGKELEDNKGSYLVQGDEAAVKQGEAAAKLGEKTRFKSFQRKRIWRLNLSIKGKEIRDDFPPGILEEE